MCRPAKAGLPLMNGLSPIPFPISSRFRQLAPVSLVLSTAVYQYSLWMRATQFIAGRKPIFIKVMKHMANELRSSLLEGFMCARGQDPWGRSQ